jgi:DNA-binding MarR family transcriptional regulator
MSLDKDIHSSKFRNEYHKAIVNIIFTNNWIMERSKEIFERGDITSQQYNILRILRGAKEPLSTLQIRQRMLDKMSDTSRIVDRLLKKELVKKVVCITDKRLVDVTITQKGLELLTELDKYNDELDNMLSSISGEEVCTLNQLLDKIRKTEQVI